MAKTQFNYTGANQIFTVPAGIYYLTVKVWGAGGGNPGFGPSACGCGGYSTATMFVTPGQTFDVMVGSKGSQTTASPYGGGGGGGNSSTGVGSAGGGRSGVAFTGQSQFIIAGGGGGDSNNTAFSTTFGGNGGGLVGSNSLLVAGSITPAVVLSTGGTQTAGGNGATTAQTILNGSNGASLAGGKGGTDGSGITGGGGGGGGGYFGGGGGNGNNGSSAPDETTGGGGSGYVDAAVVITGSTIGIPTPTVGPKALLLPPNSTDPDYVSGIGTGGTVGGNGLVVFVYTPLTLTKSVNKTNAAVGDTIRYTVVFNGDGLVYNNAFFTDTTPTNTTFVTDSVYINGTQQTGANPNPPGVNLGSIGPGSTTINFDVTVTSFPISPYTIPNAGNIFATSVPNVTSNTVSTTILGASLTGVKSVSKTSASIGDILTYTIPVINSGNTTASNILFIDTIPNGTTLIAGSLKQGITAISGSPNPPGVVLPSSIKGGVTSIVTFQVRVTAIPNPNPIPNTASLTYSYLVGTTTIASIANTNTVNTSVNFASLSGITKYVDKSFANCGDTITYTIVAPNSGTVTAQNVVFKDTLPNGTVFVPSSVFVNGVNQINSFPSTGVTIPNIGPGSTATLTFQVQVQC